MNPCTVKGAVVASGVRREHICKVMDMSKAAFSAKINGHRDFTVDEADKLGDAIGVTSPEAKGRLFFGP